MSDRKSRRLRQCYCSISEPLRTFRRRQFQRTDSLQQLLHGASNTFLILDLELKLLIAAFKNRNKVNMHRVNINRLDVREILKRLS